MKKKLPKSRRIAGDRTRADHMHKTAKRTEANARGKSIGAVGKRTGPGYRSGAATFGH